MVQLWCVVLVMLYRCLQDSALMYSCFGCSAASSTSCSWVWAHSWACSALCIGADPQSVLQQYTFRSGHAVAARHNVFLLFRRLPISWTISSNFMVHIFRKSATNLSVQTAPDHKHNVSSRCSLAWGACADHRQASGLTTTRVFLQSLVFWFAGLGHKRWLAWLWFQKVKAILKIMAGLDFVAHTPELPGVLFPPQIAKMMQHITYEMCRTMAINHCRHAQVATTSSTS